MSKHVLLPNVYSCNRMKVTHLDNVFNLFITLNLHRRFVV